MPLSGGDYQAGNDVELSVHNDEAVHSDNLYYNSPSVSRCFQTTDRNSFSIVSGDISNWSYRMSIASLTSSHLNSVRTHFYIDEKHLKHIAITESPP